MMASVFSAKGDIQADLKTLGSGEAISLPISFPWGVMNHHAEGGQGQTQARHSARQAHDTVRDWFAEGSK